MGFQSEVVGEVFEDNTLCQQLEGQVYNDKLEGKRVLKRIRTT